MPNHSGALSGAAQGAAAGASFGPWGAVIGGVVGAIGGAFGDNSAHLMRKASKDKETASLIQNFLERRALVQQYQLGRSAVLAGGLASGAGVESSGIQGAQASANTQTQSALYRNAIQTSYGRRANKYMRAAGKQSDLGDSIMGIVQGASAFGQGGGGGGYNAAAQRAGTGSYAGSGVSYPLSAPPLSIRNPTTVNTSPFSYKSGG